MDEVDRLANEKGMSKIEELTDDLSKARLRIAELEAIIDNLMREKAIGGSSGFNK